MSSNIYDCATVSGACACDSSDRSYSSKIADACRKPTGYTLGSHLSFGEAIHWLREGFRLQRVGWNGKGQYIELATNISYVTANGSVVNVDHSDIGNKAIAFHGTSGVQIGWLASQADMLADDWVVVR